MGKRLLWVAANSSGKLGIDQIRSIHVRELSPSGRYVLLGGNTYAQWNPAISIRVLGVLD